MDVPMIRFTLDDGATEPTQHLNSGGLDLYTIEDIVIQPKSVGIIKTGVYIELPPNWHALVKGRSGLDSTTFISIKTGLIDNDYRGEIGIIYENSGNVEYVFKKGKRLAQLVPFYQPSYVFRKVRALSNTERGADGFGSSGV